MKLLANKAWEFRNYFLTLINYLVKTIFMMMKIMLNAEERREDFKSIRQ